MDQDDTWHGGRPAQVSVLDGDPASFAIKVAESPPQFSAHFYCGQMAGCIKMPLGMAVGFIPGDFVFDGYPASSPKRTQSPPNFRPCLLCPNGWMDEE